LLAVPLKAAFGDWRLFMRSQRTFGGRAFGRQYHPDYTALDHGRRLCRVWTLSRCRPQPGLGGYCGDYADGKWTGITENYTVYGRVAPHATPSPGTYHDTVVVTITY